MKKCFKCGKEKDRSEFYKHPQMGDGLLGKCKECTKKDTAESHARKAADPEWAEKERNRHRLKARKAYREGTASPCTQESREKWLQNNSHKRQAQLRVARAIRLGILKRLPCEVCGDPNTHGHHHDYSKPLDVWWLCPTHHGQAHWKVNPLIIKREEKDEEN